MHLLWLASLLSCRTGQPTSQEPRKPAATGDASVSANAPDEGSASRGACAHAGAVLLEETDGDTYCLCPGPRHLSEYIRDGKVVPSDLLKKCASERTVCEAQRGTFYAPRVRRTTIDWGRAVTRDECLAIPPENLEGRFIPETRSTKMAESLWARIHVYARWNADTRICESIVLQPAHAEFAELRESAGTVEYGDSSDEIFEYRLGMIPYSHHCRLPGMPPPNSALPADYPRATARAELRSALVSLTSSYGGEAKKRLRRLVEGVDAQTWPVSPQPSSVSPFERVRQDLEAALEAMVNHDGLGGKLPAPIAAEVATVYTRANHLLLLAHLQGYGSQQQGSYEYH